MSRFELGKFQRARSLKRIEFLADYMAEGGTLKGAAAEMKLTYDHVRRLWRVIRERTNGDA